MQQQTRVPGNPEEMLKSMKKGNILLQSAYDMLRRFVGAIDRAWDGQCPQTRNTYETVEAMGKTNELKEKVIDHFYDEVMQQHVMPDGTKKTYAQLIRDRELEFLFAQNSKLVFLKQMNMYEKYMEMKDDPEFMNPMMENLDDVIGAVETFKQLPKNIHSNIDNVGMEIFQDFLNGKTNLEDLDLEEVGMKALGDQTDPAQIKGLMGSLGNLLQSNMKLLQNQQKNLGVHGAKLPAMNPAMFPPGFRGPPPPGSNPRN